MSFFPFLYIENCVILLIIPDLCSLQTDSIDAKKKKNTHTRNMTKHRQHTEEKGSSNHMKFNSSLRIIEVRHCTITNGTTVTFQIKLRHRTLILQTK